MNIYSSMSTPYTLILMKSKRDFSKANMDLYPLVNFLLFFFRLVDFGRSPNELLTEYYSRAKWRNERCRGRHKQWEVSTYISKTFANDLNFKL